MEDEITLPRTRVSPTAQNITPKSQRRQWALELRKKDLREKLFVKRLALQKLSPVNPTPKIPSKKVKKEKISCWYCGKYGHKRKTCTSRIEATAQSRLAKLERQVQKLEYKLQSYEAEKIYWQNLRKARTIRLKKKIKKRRHKARVRMQNKAVTIRSLLLQEEADPDTESFLRAANIIRKLGRKEKKTLYKTYQTLFLVDLTTDMAFSGAGYPLLPPGEPNPSEYMDVELTQEEMEEEERIMEQTNALTLFYQEQEIMDRDIQRFRQTQREQTLKRPVAKTGKEKPRNPLSVPQGKRKDIKDFG